MEIIYYLFALLTGILISVMVTFNGGLTACYGIYAATVIIHILGLLFISALVIIKRERPFAKMSVWYFYLGGAIGVTTTVFNNAAFGHISVSAILALSLFGECLTGLVFDQCGFFNMPKRPFNQRRIIGLILVLCGIVVMIDSFAARAVILSFAAGVTVVVSRILNARHANSTSVRISTFYNYLIGLIIAVLLYFLSGSGKNSFPAGSVPPNPYVYLGGIISVGVVLLSNITVGKVPSFYLSLFIFSGQVFSGVLIDAVIAQAFSPKNLIGATFVTVGLCTNLLLDGGGRIRRNVKA